MMNHKTAQPTLLFCFISTCVGHKTLSIQTGLNRFIFSWTEIRHPGFTFTYGHLQRNATLCVGSNLQLLQTKTDHWQPLNRRRRLQMLAAAFVSVAPHPPPTLILCPSVLKAHSAESFEPTWRPVSRRAGLQQAQSWKLCDWHLEPSCLLLWGTETKCHLHMLEGRKRGKRQKQKGFQWQVESLSFYISSWTWR